MVAGHFLGVLAPWLVQGGVDVYRFFSRMCGSKEETDEVDTAEQLKLLGRKIYVITLRCGASLIFASIGAGLGAILVRPTTGQWIGMHFKMAFVCLNKMNDGNSEIELF